jgi:hypothetical protein
MAHRTVRCTPDSPVPPPRHQCRWILTVGASDFWARLDVRCTPDITCSLSGAPVWARLTSARALNAAQVAVGAEVAVAPLVHRTVRCTPDSPVPPPRHQCRWILTVGASDFWARLDVRCTLDITCSLSGAPVWAPDLYARCACIKCSAGSRWRRSSRCSAGTPDSPVHTGHVR